MKEADSVLLLVKTKLKIILVMSLTMIISLMGIFFFGTHLNKEYQNFNSEMRKHLQYSTQITKIAFELYGLQYEKSMISDPELKIETENTQNRLKHLIVQVDNEIQILTKQSQQLDSVIIFNRKSAEAFQTSVNELEGRWLPFRQAILTVANRNNSEMDRREAVAYVRDNFDDLYGSGDELARLATELSKERDSIRIIISVSLLVAAFSAVVAQFVYIFRQVILPFEAVFREMKQIGVSKRTLEIQPNSKNKFIYPIVLEINNKLQKLDWLILMIQNVNKNERFYDVLEYMYQSFSEFIPLNHIGIAQIGNDGVTVNFTYGISDPSMTAITEKLLDFKVHIDHTNLHNIIDSGKPSVINNLASHSSNRTLRHYKDILIEGGIRSSITIPLKINNNPFGFVVFSSKQSHAYTEEHAQFLEVLADSIAISFNKNIFINEILYGNSLALAKLAESRDHYTGKHLMRIKKYSKMIAQFLSTDSKYKDRIDYQFIRDIEKYSELHDIGKVAIEDSILLKSGKLTDSEFLTMQKHTLYGGRVLREADASIQKGQSKIFQMGIEIAECHHEKWDGSGYPTGLKGEGIPLSSRIVSVADVFDALTSERPYKKAMAFDEAFAILMEGKNKSFDPEIIEVVVNHENEFREALGLLLT